MQWLSLIGSIQSKENHKMVVCTATQNTLASTYTALGSWVGLTTSATTPPTTNNPTYEASGSGYARLATTWGTVGAVTAGVVTGSAVTLNVGAASYYYMLLASSSAGNAMYDNASITTVVMGATGQIVVTPTFSQT